MVELVAAAVAKQGSEGEPSVINLLENLEMEGFKFFVIARPGSVFQTGELRSNLLEHGVTSPLLVYASSSVQESVKVQTNIRGWTTLVFHGRMYGPKKPDLVKLATVSFESSDLTAKTEKPEGAYCLFKLEPERVTVARDPAGVEPLYYGENETLVGFASARKALWKLGMLNTEPVPPWSLLIGERKGFNSQLVSFLTPPENVTAGNIVGLLKKLIVKSVQRRLRGVKDVAVAFSGGLDSNIIAFLAKKCDVKVHLFHVSVKNGVELESAKAAADELRLPLHVHSYSEQDVEYSLPKVVALVEEPDVLRVSVGLPIYWVAEKAASEGFDVLFSGQGADELFGGYRRYVSEYLRCGSRSVSRSMYVDARKLILDGFAKDFKICSSQNIELRLPFSSLDLIMYALALPAELKLEKTQETLRKLVLRKTAVSLGLPRVLAEKPKKAVQYSTGVDAAIKRVATRHCLSAQEYIAKLFDACVIEVCRKTA